MEIIRGSLYDYPAYYDLLFGFDWKAEVRFLAAVWEKHARKPVKRLFEPACGTGRLLFRLAKRGYEPAGLDLNPKAVAYCNRRLQRHGLTSDAVWVDDMADFHSRRKYDAGFNLINSFRHLLTQEQAEAHLRCMADVLVADGVYCLGVHLTPTECQPMEYEEWSARRGQLAARSRMTTTTRDLKQRREEFDLELDVFTPTRQFRICDHLIFRTYTVAQFDRLLASEPRFELVAAYDFGYDIDEPLELDGASEDVVYVLRKCSK